MRIVISMFLCGYLHAAEPRWIRIQSANFEIYSTASESNTRNALQQFEQVRAFLLQSTSYQEEKPAPVRIVAFNSAKEYEPYRPNEVAIAYYRPGAERDTIVMSHLGSETFPLAIHEYVHVVVQHIGLKAPPWLNEGLAELYSTLHQVGGKTLVGEIIPGRRQELLEEKWVPLAVILSADHDSPYYNEKNRAGALYNEGWALTHMLMLSPQYRPKSLQFMQAMMQGKDSIDALTSTYDMPLAAIERDLQDYLRGSRFLAAVFPTKLEKISQDLTPEPAPLFDVKLTLLDLADRPGRESQTMQQLQELAAEQPKRPEPYAQMGYVYLRNANSAEAQKQFATAFELGGRSPRMLWDYGRMTESGNPQASGAALKELLALEPGRADVRIELGAAQLNSGQAGEAVATLSKLTTLSSDLAPRYFSIAAYAALRLGDRDQAKKLAERLLSASKATDADRQRAQELLKFLNQR